MQTGLRQPETKVSGSTNLLADSSCESPLVGACREASELLLGLQSKCSTRKVVGASHSPGNLTRASSSNDTGVISQTNESRSHRSARPSTRSRNLLLNKIEEIKQKYYERELEIEICQDEQDYEAQIGAIDQLEIQYGPELPLRSIHEISAIRQQLVQKLRRRKLQKHPPLDSSDPSDPELSVTVHNELELYSREGIHSIEESVRESFRENRSPREGRERLNLSRSSRQDPNRSVSRSSNVLNNDSFEEKVEFSEYSNNETLQEIRELDEEDEEYRSKMPGESRLPEGDRGQSQRRQKDSLNTIHRSRKQLQSGDVLHPTPTRQPSLPLSQLSHQKGKSSCEPPSPSDHKPLPVPFPKTTKILLF